MTAGIPHEVILASAGTGKTYALSNRIVRLLALGASPDSIVALTFTRKAAAEFTSKVLTKLSAAASDDVTARNLSEELGLGDYSREQFLRLLADVVRSIDRLQFGTLDSFFQRVAATFPFELGLPGNFEIIEGAAIVTARERVFRSLLRPGRRTPDVCDAMIEAFRLATWGTEEKNLERSLVGFVTKCHRLFLRADDARRWGEADVIWPSGSPWLPVPESIASSLEIVRDWLIDRDGPFADALARFIDFADDWNPGVPLSKETLLPRLLVNYDALERGDTVEITYNRKTCEISGPVAVALADVLRKLIAGSIEPCLHIARGIYRILADYEVAYEREVRAAGELGFDDVTQVLRRDLSLDWQFRLDSQVSHWLFDEFQDTSVLQWSVVANLLDEILQDNTGRRTAFFVGDPKQSIYRWRGGEHRLMTGLRDHYAPVLAVRSLELSYRSASPVIDLVNAFGQRILTSRPGLPEDSVAEWSAVWRDHTTARTDLAGYAVVRSCDGKELPMVEILELLGEIDPVRRGLTCAILVRSNDDVRTIARGLREAKITEVVSETDEAVVMDNPVTRAILALFSAVAHPADTASEGFAGMTPLGAWIAGAGGLPKVRNDLMRTITVFGFEAAVEVVIAGVREDLPAIRFVHHRLGQLALFARDFDRRGSRDIDTFLETLAEQKHRESAGAGWIQVMTIHKAKGLGFQVVILPVWESTRLDTLPDDILLSPEDAEYRPQWVIKRPAEIVASADPVLGKATADLRAAAAYEALCLWYVALTRAEQGCYVLLPPPNRSTETEAISAARLLRDAVSGEDTTPQDRLWEKGDPLWFADVVPDENVTLPASPEVSWSNFPARTRLARVRPSRVESPTFDARVRLDLVPTVAGSTIHSLFAEITWLDSAADWQPPTNDQQNARIVSRCLAVPEIFALFQSPSREVTLWRERAFDVVLDRQWITGAFDRVLLFSDSAILVDFKTGAARPSVTVRRHSPQLLLYRSALAQLTGLSVGKIRVVIVHTATRSVLEVGA